MNCLRVLIVEDEMIIALSLELMVEELGHTVCTITTSAQTALAATAECRPDVVLIGYPALPAAAMDRRGPADPAVLQHSGHLLSASLDRDTVDQARATRPLGFLHKPFSAKELERILAFAADHLAAKVLGQMRVAGSQNLRNRN